MSLPVEKVAKTVGHIICFKENVPEHDKMISLMSRNEGLRINHKYDKTFKGFSTVIPYYSLQRIQNKYKNVIESIMPDLEVKTCAQTIPWGIQRVGATNSNSTVGIGSGISKDIDVFVLDTGVLKTHPDLNVVESLSFITTEKDTNDLNGHGTAVAGIIAARDNNTDIVGIVPGARIHSYKVANRFGSGSFSSIIAGINQVIRWKQLNPNVQNKVVINLSVGGFTGSSSYTALDNAVLSAIQNNITVVIASGNSKNDAIYYTPAHVTEAITVGAYSNTNVMASWSNYGSVVDILAPGVSILSTYLNGLRATLSGTSFAAPHVSGAAALYLLSNPTSTPASVLNALKNYSLNSNNSNITVSVPNTTNKSVYLVFNTIEPTTPTCTCPPDCLCCANCPTCTPSA